MNLVIYLQDEHLIGAALDISFDYREQQVNLSRAQESVSLTFHQFQKYIGLIDLLFTDVYPIGTVVTLIDGEQQSMITSRFPLYENQGARGYFDYAGCIFPQGQINENNYFLLKRIFKTVHFEGYKSEEEIRVREDLMKRVPSIKYQKLSVKDTNWTF